MFIICILKKCIYIYTYIIKNICFNSNNNSNNNKISLHIYFFMPIFDSLPLQIKKPTKSSQQKKRQPLKKHRTTTRTKKNNNNKSCRHSTCGLEGDSPVEGQEKCLNLFLVGELNLNLNPPPPSK